jgi:ammonia channel protein AmtB
MNASAAAAAAQPLLDWIAAHPYQTFFHVVNGVVLLTPAAATVPLFSALGLSAGGPIAGASSPLHPQRSYLESSSPLTTFRLHSSDNNELL